MKVKRKLLKPRGKVQRFFRMSYLISPSRWLLLGAVVLVVLVITSTMASAGPQGATPWAVIKCKFSDQPQEPAFDPSFVTGTNGMAGYWQDVSYGQINLNGTTVYGWYTLPYTSAQLTNRSQRINACIDAAQTHGVNISQYYSVIAIINQQVDSGSIGGHVLLDPAAWHVTFAGHEMGHCYNLDHSFDDTGVVYDSGSDSRPGAYGDGWDIMSAENFGRSNPTFVGPYGNSGPGLNAPNLEKLGWLTANRVWTWNRNTSQTVSLAALNHPEAGGYFMAKVPYDANNPNHYYTVEFRRKTGWDAGIPQDTVLIHEVRPDGLSYLVRTNGGAQRLPNQTFHDVQNNVAITVLSIDSASSTAVVNIGKDDVWVDFAWQGSENGSFSLPFNTLAEGINAVRNGGTTHIKAGSRNEPITINKPVTLQAYGGSATIGQ